LNIRENVMAILHHEKPERIPWLTYDIPYPMLPRGAWERELRNKGLGVIGLMGFYPCGDVYNAETPNVEVTQKPTRQGGRRIIETTYRTPIGELTKKEDWSISPPNAWMLEYPVKGASDYDALKFIVEDTVYEPNYDAFYWVDKQVGGDGYVRADCKTPFQELLISQLGYKGLAMGIYRYKKELEELMKAMERRYFELVRILADCPAEVIGVDGNINGRVASPALFKKYLLPLYHEASEILHAKGKVVSAHMDGALACLKDLIPETGIDVIEAFTPPPLGDLPIEEARRAWGNHTIISVNFPETVCLEGVDAVRRYTTELLRKVAPGDGFMLTVTEDIPYRAPNDILEASLRVITDIMWEHGKYPIRP